MGDMKDVTKDIDFRQGFTENAKEFDSLMILMLAENKSFKEENEQLQKDKEELVGLLRSLTESKSMHIRILHQAKDKIKRILE